ncbi:MAG TPA: chorismate mutase [Acholeplasmataceae bacterium]|jgi:monofunctional chorismate mutase|nr:chorismate mutase [Acholeplasmataceae bacterium]HPG43903.1 chorismate mutase [Acholeplasmataceae bacterium]HRX45268.1 chorismate mutase [Acholeplasmataceae bacterium]
MNLNELRKEIDLIDEQMMELFKKRMAVSKQIGKVKIMMGLPIVDHTRETLILEKRQAQLNHEELWPYYQAFLIKLFDLSKDYQHHV